MPGVAAARRLESQEIQDTLLNVALVHQTGVGAKATPLPARLSTASPPGTRCSRLSRTTGYRDCSMSRYHDVMTRQTTVRLPQELADQAEAVARVRGTSVNSLIVDSLAGEIERVRADEDFTARARTMLERDKELLDRLAR